MNLPTVAAQMTVGSTQRFYVVVKVGPGKVPKLQSAPGGVEQSALLWECVWQVGARLLALVGGDQRPHYLPQDNSTVDFGKVSLQQCQTPVRKRTFSVLVIIH